MHVDAKSASCSISSHGDPKPLFLPGSTFQTDRKTVSTALIFVNIICLQPESTLPKQIENNKNHQITLPKGWIRFSSLNVVDEQDPKYHIRNPYELTKVILSTDAKYNDCFLLHLTIPAKSPDDCLQTIHGTENLIMQRPHSIGHCFSADAKISKGFTDLLSQRFPGFRDACRGAKILT